MKLGRMAQTTLTALAVVVLVAGTVACQTTRPVSEQADDAGITAKVKAKLAADPQINPFEIDVDTNEGVVRLSGFVDEERQRREAEEIARTTDGVMSVQNEIQVGGKSVGAMIDDAVIVTKVKSKLVADPQVRAFNIDVDSQKGVVTLTGRVENQQAKTQAEQLARETDGVREVRNQLQVGEQQQPPQQP